MSDDQKAAFEKLVKEASKAAVKQGLLKAELPKEYVDFLAGQLTLTYDLVKKGRKISSKDLGFFLAQQTLSTTKLALNGQHECAIAVVFMSMSFVKTGLSSVSGPLGLLTTSVFLLKDVYDTTNACATPVQKKINEVVAPTYMWMESEIIKALFRGYL
ncbi:hypothetical protein ACFSUS_10980 [Spirosoma soli]|uniref:Uncharacterized protein n=1 Tax=Spirosoma soli TaxID=1770529 RepID=A0ABW5M4X4_9BACT